MTNKTNNPMYIILDFNFIFDFFHIKKLIKALEVV
jgi:hypothetical protein